MSKVKQEDRCKELAHRHIEAFLSECDPKTRLDAKLAAEIMFEVSLECMQGIKHGRMEVLPNNKETIKE